MCHFLMPGQDFLFTMTILKCSRQKEEPANQPMTTKCIGNANAGPKTVEVNYSNDNLVDTRKGTVSCSELMSTSLYFYLYCPLVHYILFAMSAE